MQMTVLLGNAPAQAESLEHTAGDFGLWLNANKTEYMCFNRERVISTLNGSPLKLEKKFTCLNSSISSTESNVNIRLVKS